MTNKHRMYAGAKSQDETVPARFPADNLDLQEDLQPDPGSTTSLPVERSGRLLSFDWPVDEARLTRGFLPRKRGRPHLGIDLAAHKGTPIFAAHDGVVIYAGRDFRGYGKMVMIESEGKFATLYAHFSKIVIKQGAKVRIGDTIGLMGRTGHATGSHLHFEVRTKRGPVDPLPYLPKGSYVAQIVDAGMKKPSNRF